MLVKRIGGRRRAAIVAGTATSLLLATLTYRAGASNTVNVLPSAGSHVSSAVPTATFGSASQLNVAGSPTAPSVDSIATRPPTRAPATPAPASDPVLIGAGDICVTKIIGNAAATAKLVEAHPTAQVFTLGDNSNEKGSTTQYLGCYAKTWGAFLSRTRAVVGNHDCMLVSCGAYYKYFGAAAGPAGKGYYSYDLPNDWHVVVLNSQGAEIGGTGVGSPEELWLRADLAASKGKHIIAMWHIPVFATGQLKRPTYVDFWNDLYAAHADLILNGHDHVYERFGLQSPSGRSDPKGIREIVVGTGGASPQTFGSKIAANSQVRHNGTFGVLMLTLRAHSYSWRFIPVKGSTFADSGTQATHS